jgi:hypothetical protein
MLGKYLRVVGFIDKLISHTRAPGVIIIFILAFPRCCCCCCCSSRIAPPRPRHSRESTSSGVLKIPRKLHFDSYHYSGNFLPRFLFALFCLESAAKSNSHRVVHHAESNELPIPSPSYNARFFSQNLSRPLSTTPPFSYAPVS